MIDKTAETKIKVGEEFVRLVAAKAVGIRRVMELTPIEFEAFCDAFAEALAENPIVPTETQWKSLRLQCNLSDKMLAVEWQRKMFLAPSEVIPPSITYALHGWIFTEKQNLALKELIDRNTGRSAAYGTFYSSLADTGGQVPEDCGFYIPASATVTGVKMEAQCGQSPVQEVAEAVRPFADVYFKKPPIQERFEENETLKELLIDEQGDREGFYRPSVFNQKLREAYRMGKEAAVQK